jgi:hypothetical protein
MSPVETILAVCIAIGLSGACGFRVFVPLLVMSIAAHTGNVQLGPNFQWLATTPALVTFSLATLVEIIAYYIPWLDHLLDTVAAPAAVIAGMVITASLVTDVSPFLRWTLAVIAGGGSAGIVQGTTMLARGLSLVGTGGLANPIVSTAELGGAVVTSVLAIVLPIVAVLLVFVVCALLLLKVLRFRRGKTIQS